MTATTSAPSETYQLVAELAKDRMRMKGQEAKEVAAEKRNKYVNPKDPRKIRWDMYCGVLIVYSVLIIPWRIGFDVDATGLIAIFDICVDCCFAVDMFMCFWTAYTEEERLVTDLPTIRWNYVKTWFVPDLLSTVPIDKVAGILLGGGGGSGDALSTDEGDLGFNATGILDTTSEDLSSLSSLGLIRILRLARLLKLMRLLKLSKKIAGSEDKNELINPAIKKLLSVLGKIIFIAHLLSCVWFGVNECVPLKSFDPPGVNDVGMCESPLIDPDTGTCTWTVNNKGEDVLVRFEQEWGMCGHSGLFSQYLSAFYWTITTMMAVGYGDISPSTTSERLFGITTQVVGSMAFGLIIATVGIIVETVNPEATFRKRRLDELNAFLAERGVTKQLKRQVKEHFEHYFASKTVFDEAGILMDLPVALRTQVIFESRREDLNSLKIFRRLDIVLVVDLVVKLKPMCMQYRQTMGYTGCVCAETYFVQKGKVQALMTLPDPAGTTTSMSICGLFKDGDDFELDAMLTSQEMRCTYRAVSVTDLFWIESSDFYDVLDEYPGCANKLQIYAESHKARMDGAIQSGSEEVEGIGLAQNMVVCDGKLVPLASVIDQFDSGASQGESIQKIRTYRMVNSETIQGSQANLAIGGMSSNVRSAPERSLKRSVVKPEDGEEDCEEDGEEDGEKGDPSATPTKKSRTSSGLGASFRIHSHPLVQVEVEETTADLGKRWIINPKHGKKIFWDLFIGALILWSVIIVPYRLGFDQEPEAGSMGEMIDIFQDLMFGVDIALCFRVAYLDDQLVYVTEPRSIASNYLSSWFWIDFLSTFPIDRIIIAINSGGGGGGVDYEAYGGNGTAMLGMGEEEESGSAARSLKMIKVLRLIRLSKLAKLLKLKNLVKGLDEILALSAVVMKFLQLVITLVFVGHLFGCFWNYSSSNFVSMVYGEEEEVNLWWNTSLLQDSDLDPEDVSSMYITSLYWAFTTMTTCGYGDIVPTNDVERVYAIFIMIMGATIFGYIVGTVGSLAINVNGAPARRHARVSTATNYLEEQNMPKSWTDAVTKQLVYFFDCKSPFNEDGGLLGMMPRELRREIILQAHRDIIPQVPLFKRQSRDFVSTVLTKMRPHCISKDGLILSSIDGSDGVYFLLKGTARMFLKNPDDDKPGNSGIFIDSGRFFGHEIYVKEDLMSSEGFDYEREYKAVTDCYLFVLLDIDIAGLLDSFPMIGAQLKLALHQMICSQPPIKPTQQRARKQRKSVRAFAFGSSGRDLPIHPEGGGEDDAAESLARAARLNELNGELEKERRDMDAEVEKRHVQGEVARENERDKSVGYDRREERSVRFGDDKSEASGGE